MFQLCMLLLSLLSSLTPHLEGQAPVEREQACRGFQVDNPRFDRPFMRSCGVNVLLASGSGE